MKLCKIHANDCEVCATLGSSAKTLADENKFGYFEIELSELALNDSSLTQYIINYHVDEEGMVDVPIYLILTEEYEIQGSAVVKTLEEVKNLIEAWKKWDASKAK